MLPREQNAQRRNVALHFWPQEATSFSTQWNFAVLGALSIETSGLARAWTNWYETCLDGGIATVIVIVVVACWRYSLGTRRRR